MNESGDFYKKLDRDKSAGGARVPDPIAMDPVRMRRRMMLTTALLVLLMAGLLGLGTWFLQRQEEQIHALTPEELPSPLVPPRVPTTSLPTLSTLLPTDVAEQAEASASPTGIEPERVAQAMSEVRTGAEYLRAYSWSQAELHARRALEIWPDMTAALRLLGVVFTQRGQFDQAIAYLERALKAEPFNVEIYVNLSTAYMQKGLFEKAEELLKNALLISPGYPVAYLNLGMISLLRGRFDLAADYLGQVVERVPNDPPPRNNLAVALIRLGQFEEAREHLQYLVERFPELPNPYFNMAITYVLDNDFEQAMAWIRQGAAHCSPMACQQYLADTDFDAIRGTSEFQSFLTSLVPNLPELPQ